MHSMEREGLAGSEDVERYILSFLSYIRVFSNLVADEGLFNSASSIDTSLRLF